VQLSAYYAAGLGCKRDISESLKYFRLAATFGNGAAQIMIHRLFAAHGESVPDLEGEDDFADEQNSTTDTEMAGPDTDDESCDSAGGVSNAGLELLSV